MPIGMTPVKGVEGRGGVRPGRRTFIGWLGAAAGLMAIAGKTGSCALARPAIPMPQYLPTGYLLTGTFTDRPDGFGTGKEELAFLYVNPKHYAARIKSPLLIFISPMTDKLFAGIVDHPAEVISLTIGNTTTEAKYVVGMGKFLPGGDFNGSLNSLVFPFAGFMIGIRGSKQGGVGRTELIKIARSFKHTR